MNIITIARVLGLMLSSYSLTLIAPLVIAFFDKESHVQPFLLTAFFTFCMGVVLYLITYSYEEVQPRLKDGFIIVVLFWVVLGLLGTLPFYLSPYTNHLNFSDMVFESMSGLTTTGATIFESIEYLPASLLFYRQQLQWFGGMGIIVLAIAVLPALGVGGQMLFKAEVASPIKDQKLSPRISETARALWGIYVGLTVACAVAYKLAGMSWFDAICHSFSTISIGGFSTYDNSLGHFESSTIETIAIIFMLIAAINFSLHFNTWYRRDLSSLKTYFQDTETKTFFIIITTLSLTTITILSLFHMKVDFLIVRQAIFQAVSIATTTGFTTTDWYNWPLGLPYILLFVSCIGACAGSTGGGAKVIRFLLLFRQGLREVTMTIHPRAVIPLRLNGQIVPERLINSIWGFFALYISVFFILLILLLLVGESPLTAYSTLLSSLNNLGPAMGEASVNYATLSSQTKYILAFAMLVGRLEFYTLVVLLLPVFWRT